VEEEAGVANKMLVWKISCSPPEGFLDYQVREGGRYHGFLLLLNTSNASKHLSEKLGKRCQWPKPLLLTS
jgi:hypothetical protein